MPKLLESLHLTHHESALSGLDFAALAALTPAELKQRLPVGPAVKVAHKIKVAPVPEGGAHAAAHPLAAQEIKRSHRDSRDFREAGLHLGRPDASRLDLPDGGPVYVPQVALVGRRTKKPEGTALLLGGDEDAINFQQRIDGGRPVRRLPTPPKCGLRLSCLCPASCHHHRGPQFCGGAIATGCRWTLEQQGRRRRWRRH